MSNKKGVILKGSNPNMERRKFLSGSIVAAFTSISGCVNDDDDDESVDGSDSDKKQLHLMNLHVFRKIIGKVECLQIKKGWNKTR